jgi:uncharacterized protein YggE
MQVPPDSVTLVVKVSGRAPTLREAIENTDRSVAGLQESLKLLGLERPGIALSDMNQGRNNEYQDQTLVQKGYYAQRVITLFINQLPMVPKVLQALSKDDNLELASYKPVCNTMEQRKTEAREKALTSAREKASAMAKVLGMQIGGPTEIIDQTDDEMRNMYTVNGVATDAADITKIIDAFSLSVRVVAEVDVTFEMHE